MLYAKIKKSHDNKQVFKKIDNHYEYIKTVIQDELYTMNEIKKYSIPTSWYDVVDYPKNESYFCFGCRYNTKQDK